MTKTAESFIISETDAEVRYLKFTREDTKVIKGIAICLMLCHHLFAYPTRVIEPNTFVSFFTFGSTSLATYIGQFGIICIPTFLFLGGFGTYLSASKVDDVGTLVTGRIVGLYKLVWQVFLLSLPFSIFFHRNMGSTLTRSVIYNFLTLDCSFNEEWWFILPYAVMLAFFPAVKRLLDRKGATLGGSILLIVIFSLFYNYFYPEILKLPFCDSFRVSQFQHRFMECLQVFPAFYLGCVFAKYSLLDKIREKLGGKPLWCVISLIFMAGIFYIHLYNKDKYDFINGAVFVCCLTVWLPVGFMKYPWKLFRALGEESTFMWLTHTFFCYYWCQRLVYAPKYAVLIFLWLLVLSFLAAKLIRAIWEYIGKLFVHCKLTDKK